jgi:glycosyltransferase involved in cell wall biosynthesis
MKIVVCTHRLPRDEPGGVGSFTVNTAGELAAAGHEVTLIAGSALRPAAPSADAALIARRRGAWLEEDEPAAPGVRTLRLFRRDRARTALGRFTATFTDGPTEQVLREALAELRPDVLHIQHTLDLTARLGSIGADAGAAVVATVHDFWPICQRIDLRQPDGTQCPGPSGGLRCAGCLPPLYSRWLDRGAINPWDAWQRLRRAGQRALEVGTRAAPYALRTQLVQGGYALAHRITCPAPFVAELLQGAGFDGKRIVVVDYGIPPIAGHALTAERPRPGRFRFGFLGTLGPHKGPWVALRAAELLGAQSTSWTFKVHGGPLRDPLLRERLHEATDRTGGRIEYQGPYTADRLPGILAGLDAVVIPSLWRETGPMVWMEAMAAGVPVVASRVGALAHRVRHGVDGLLFAPGDAAALAGSMREVIELYPQLRRGAVNRGVRTVTQAAGELLAVYEEARGGKGRSPAARRSGATEDPARGGKGRSPAARRSGATEDPARSARDRS